MPDFSHDSSSRREEVRKTFPSDFFELAYDVLKMKEGRIFAYRIPGAYLGPVVYGTN